jgi:hypothetical protein
MHQAQLATRSTSKTVEPCARVVATDDRVVMTVTVQIGNRDRFGRAARRIIGPRRKATLTVTEQH